MIYLVKVPREYVEQVARDNPEMNRTQIAACVGLSRERVRQILGNKGRTPRLCSVCGVTILRKGSHVAYRNSLCSLHWHAKLEGEHLDRLVTLKCEICGEDFQRYKWDVEQSKLGRRPRIRFCSNKCQGFSMAKKAGLGRGSRVALYEFTCETCSEKFWLRPCEVTVRIGKVGPRFCSQKCNVAPKVQRTCETCHKTFEVKKPYTKRFPARFCSNKCQRPTTSKEVRTQV